MIQIDEDEVIVGKRLFSAGFNDDGSVKQIDSTDVIYESFEEAFEDVSNPLNILYGGMTDESVSDEFKGIITFKRSDKDIDNVGHSMILDIYKHGRKKAQYCILPVVINKLQIIAYRGMFIQPFDIGKYLICRRDHKELSVKKSLDLAFSFIDTYLLINPEWQ